MRIRIAALIFSSFLCFTPPAAAQRNTIATSLCFSRDGFAVTFVRTEVIGTDSLAEILAHEARHRQQYAAHFAADSTCGSEASDSMLAREIDAYCVSDSLRVLRTHDLQEASITTLARLLTQFADDSVLSQSIIIRRWFQSGCKYALSTPRR